MIEQFGLEYFPWWKMFFKSKKGEEKKRTLSYKFWQRSVFFDDTIPKKTEKNHQNPCLNIDVYGCELHKVNGLYLLVIK